MHLLTKSDFLGNRWYSLGCLLSASFFLSFTCLAVSHITTASASIRFIIYFQLFFVLLLFILVSLFILLLVVRYGRVFFIRLRRGRRPTLNRNLIMQLLCLAIRLFFRYCLVFLIGKTLSFLEWLGFLWVSELKWIFFIFIHNVRLKARWGWIKILN